MSSPKFFLRKPLAARYHFEPREAGIALKPKPKDRASWIRAAISCHEQALLRYALRITKNPETARDVVQDTFFRLCEAEKESVEGHVAAWLYRVCRNRALDVCRKEKPMRQAGDNFTSTPSGEPSPQALLEKRQSMGRVLGLLDALPDKQQEVIRLKFQHGLSYREISEVTGHSMSYVGNLIHHGVKALREQLDDAQLVASRSTR